MKILFVLVVLLTTQSSSAAVDTVSVDDEILGNAHKAVVVIYRPEVYPSKNHPQIKIEGNGILLERAVPQMSYLVEKVDKGEYTISSKTYKHIPKQISLSVTESNVYYIRISHGTGWVDVWYDLLESNKQEFDKNMHHDLFGKMERVR